MKGFTLVEALVAIAIITIAISAPLYTASKDITAAQNAQSQMIASHLAQEGIETVRWIRDNAYLAAYGAGDPNATTDAWNEFLHGSNPDTDTTLTQCIDKNCIVEVTAGTPFSVCPGNDCSSEYLYLLPSTSDTFPGVYTQDASLAASKGGVITPFVRVITLSSVSATEELVTSKVTWTFHNVPYSVTVTDHLTPWQ